jgi:hypothetical protein
MPLISDLISKDLSRNTIRNALCVHDLKPNINLLMPCLDGGQFPGAFRTDVAYTRGT